MITKVNIVGSHGLYASYGGWDQLVINLVELKGQGINYRIFNPKETPKVSRNQVTVTKLPLSGSGFQGLLFDSLSLVLSISADFIIMLGMKAMPVAMLLKLINPRLKLLVNIGGVEWERPQFNRVLKIYLKFCFFLVKVFANKIVIDNDYYKRFFAKKYHHKLEVISYGGYIDSEYKIEDQTLHYEFLENDYFLSVSRSIEDNKINELCSCFEDMPDKNLVLISNLSNSIYGKKILSRYKDKKNIYLIDGLYDKKKLDLIRRCCKAYIHTHTLCGSAPSLIEMIICNVPIYSIDVVQNRNTLKGEGKYFSDFDQLKSLIIDGLPPSLPSKELASCYSWQAIVLDYEKILTS